MLQIAKWDLLQCDQCYLSEDNGQLNAGLDERVVMRNSKSCKAVEAKEGEGSYATPQSLSESLF